MKLEITSIGLYIANEESPRNGELSEYSEVRLEHILLSGKEKKPWETPRVL